MTTGQIVVVLLRLVGPLLILRRPLTGGLLAMTLDLLDVVIVEQISTGGMGDHYSALDKGLDTYYLSLEAWVAYQWTERLPRLVALVSFFYRLLGVILFELTGTRWLLFVFPNLFENWFLFVAARNRFFPGLALETWPQVLRWLLVLYIPKLGQEWMLHIQDFQPWDWIKDNLLGE